MNINLIKSILGGLKDAALIPSLIKQNRDSLPEKGKMNWIRFATAIGTLGLSAWLVYEVINGRITIEQAEELHKIID